MPEKSFAGFWGRQERPGKAQGVGNEVIFSLIPQGDHLEIPHDIGPRLYVAVRKDGHAHHGGNQMGAAAKGSGQEKGQTLP